MNVAKIKELVDKIPEKVFFFNKWMSGGIEGLVSALSVFMVYFSISCISISMKGVSGVWIFETVPSLLSLFFAMGLVRKTDASDAVALKKAVIGLIAAVAVCVIVIGTIEYKLHQLNKMVGGMFGV